MTTEPQIWLSNDRGTTWERPEDVPWRDRLRCHWKLTWTIEVEPAMVNAAGSIESDKYRISLAPAIPPEKSEPENCEHGYRDCSTCAWVAGRPLEYWRDGRTR